MMTLFPYFGHHVFALLRPMRGIALPVSVGQLLNTDLIRDFHRILRAITLVHVLLLTVRSHSRLDLVLGSRSMELDSDIDAY